MSLPRPDIAPLGDRAFTLSFRHDDDATVNGWVSGFCQALRKIPAITDVVPAFNRICVHYEPLMLLRNGIDPQAWMEEIQRLSYVPLTAMSATRHRIPVCYHDDFAPDLSVLADALSLSKAAIVDLHMSAEYRVGMIGFAPGFPYLTGLPEVLRVPRRANPRTRVEPGSVAIAEHMCGIYPKALPGGWHVIGRSPVPLFDPGRAQPCLLTGGDVVNFYAITREQFEAWPC